MVNTRRLGTVLASAFVLGAAALAGTRKKRGPQPAPPSPPTADNTPAPQPATPSQAFQTDPAPAAPGTPAGAVPPAPAQPPHPLHMPPDADTPGPGRQRTPAPETVAPIVVAPLAPVGGAGRKLAVFGAGLALGALAVAGGWMLLGPSTASSPFRAGGGSALQAVGLAALEAPQPSACPAQPTVPAANEKDGRFPLQNDMAGLIAADIGTFIVLGKESAAAGRPHDAEVAFLMSCRLADKLKGPDSVEAADARYQLAAHYAGLALAQPDAGTVPRRAEWLAQARRLYGDSLRIYTASHGPAHEKSRFAAQGLAAVEAALTQAPPEAPPAAAPPEPAAPPAAAAPAATPPKAPIPRAVPPRDSASRPRPTAAAPRPAPPAEAARATPAAEPREAREPRDPRQVRQARAARWSGPSFDCNKARSAAEVMICSDAELSQLDRELGRVYARAKKATRHPAAFRQRNEAEWRRREADCRDRECLRRWYEHRRNELMNTIEGRE